MVTDGADNHIIPCAGLHVNYTYHNYDQRPCTHYSYKGRYTVTVHGGGPIVSTIGRSPCTVTDYHIHADFIPHLQVSGAYK